MGKKTRRELDRDLDELVAKQREVEKAIAVLEGKRCRTHYSFCLDCRYHNGCPRYAKHLEGM